MARCSYCGTEEMMPFRCKFCGQPHCADHRLPENHGCLGLVEYKEKRMTSPEKWGYEPFREDRKRAPAGRVRKRPILDRMRVFLSRQKPIYILLGFIILYLIVDLVSR